MGMTSVVAMSQAFAAAKLAGVDRHTHEVIDELRSMILCRQGHQTHPL